MLVTCYIYNIFRIIACKVICSGLLPKRCSRFIYFIAYSSVLFSRVRGVLRKRQDKEYISHKCVLILWWQHTNLLRLALICM